MHKLYVKRPLKFLNLFTLGPKMSITAKVSILHRISGFLLFLSIPFLIYVLDKSLTNADFYSTLYGVCSSVYMKILYLVLLWAFFHHICAGVRFLFLDIHRGVEIKTAKTTARFVIVVSLICTVLIGVLIW